jgi:aminoglycoside phosphotransferase (APT) family kinase protein
MSETTPPQKTRLQWHELPAHLRAGIEARLGAAVVSAASQSGGFSPGVAAILTLANGEHVFVKAVSAAINPDSPEFNRKEAVIAAALPADAPVPRYLWSLDEGGDGWVVLAFEAVEGRTPREPWTDADLDLVVDALVRLSEALTPSPLPTSIAPPSSESSFFGTLWWRRMRDEMPPDLDPWIARNVDRLVELELRTASAVDGNSLAHHDIRGDNLLITERGVIVVDWPHARTSVPWLDMLGMAPSLRMEGGPPPNDFLLRHPAARAADPRDLDATIATLAGAFITFSLQPPPPALPTIRKFQADQGVVTLEWLKERTGWS